MGFLFSTQGPNALPASNLSPNTTAAAVVNNTATAITNGVSSVANSVANAVGLGTPKNNKGILTNLGNILATPVNRRNGSLL